MVATVARAENDFYRTPEWASQAIVRRLQEQLHPRRILEPAAGDGALLASLRAAWPEATIDAYDVEPRHPSVVKRDFWFDDTPQRYDLVMTNPPFSHAMEFVRYGLSKLDEGGRLVLLLRLAFLESEERASFFKRNEPDVYVLSARPSFRNGATDPKTAYAWFVWRHGRRRRSRGWLEHL